MAHMASYALRISTLTLCLGALCPATAFSQVDSDVSSAATPAAAQAYVYVGTTKGVYLYNAASNGSLSLVSGSPFSITGSAVGSNGKYFVSLGTTYLRSYPVASNGAIKGQASQINATLYQGASCGTVYGGTIDRTGTEAHILFQFLGPYDEGCDALQSYKINATTGAFTFGGVAQFGGVANQALGSPLVIAGNNGHAYTFTKHYCANDITAFSRDKFGVLNLSNASGSTWPPAPGDGGLYFPIAMASDNQNVAASHMAIAIHETYDDYCGPSGPPTLASFTVGSNGNTIYNGAMIKTAINPASMAINPQGNLLAVGGNTSNTDNSGGKQTAGLQVFHFNGANPITSFSKVLITAPINEIRWDNNNHLYAVSNSTHKLYAYTVTSSTITAVPGSPYTIAAAPNALVVVPTSAACSAPASAGVHICAPTNGSTVSSPVSVKAASTVTGTIARMELWVDGVKKYTATSTRQLNTTISLAAGSHRFGVFAVNTAGQKWQSVVTATVK
jgi:Bacterial Ig domain